MKRIIKKLFVVIVAVLFVAMPMTGCKEEGQIVCLFDVTNLETGEKVSRAEHVYFTYDGTEKGFEVKVVRKDNRKEIAEAEIKISYFLYDEENDKWLNENIILIEKGKYSVRFEFVNKGEKYFSTDQNNGITIR